MKATMYGWEMVWPRSSGSGVSSYADARCCGGTNSSRGTERKASRTRLSVTPRARICWRIIRSFSSRCHACSGTVAFLHHLQLHDAIFVPSEGGKRDQAGPFVRLVLERGAAPHDD